MQTIPEPSSVGHRPGSREYRAVQISLFAAGVATFALLYSPQGLLPQVADTFGVSSGGSTLALSLTTAGLACALLVAGPASDAWGRTPLIKGSIVAASVVGLAVAVAPTWHSLLALRLLEGVVLAGLPAVATAYLREELHPDVHARAAGLYIAGTAFGGMLGRLATGGVAELLGWRWGMAVVALMGLVCAAVVLWLLPASRGHVVRPAGWRALARGTVRIVADPVLLALYVIGACGAGAAVGLFNALGFRLQAEPFALGVGTASLVFLVYVFGSVSSASFGRAAGRFGRRPVVPVAGVLGVVGVVATLGDHLWLVVVGTAVTTIGYFGVHAVASGWVPARAHAVGGSASQAASLYLFTYYVGSSVFGSLAGHAWSEGGWTSVALLTGGLLLLATVVAVALMRSVSLLDGAGRRPAGRSSRDDPRGPVSRR